MASLPASAPPHLQALSPAQNVFDELLEEIFIRLPTAADLARVSMACASFGRVIAGHGFLRRFRALHPPPLLGILYVPFLPAQPPHPSAAAARTMADSGADFWCSFLPNRERWGITDVRDGRILLAGVPEGKTYPWGGQRLLRDFAVCDPVHLLVDGLNIIDDVDYFLAPPGEDGDDLSFRVICSARRKTKLIIFVFARDAGEWRTVSFDSESGLSWASKRYYWRRCFCWVVMPTNKLLMFHTDRMKFSAINLPLDPWPEEYELTFVETAGGRLGMFTIYDDFDEVQGGVVFHLGYHILRKRKNRATRWTSNAMIPLPLTYRYYRIMGVAGGYLLLQGSTKGMLSIPMPDGKETDIFSLNLRTLQLAPFCVASDIIYEDNLYAGYPPSLSAPTI